MESTVRNLCDQVSTGLAQPWVRSIRHASTSRFDDLGDLLDRVVATTDLGDRDPRPAGHPRAGCSFLPSRCGWWRWPGSPTSVSTRPPRWAPRRLFRCQLLVLGVLLVLLSRALIAIGARSRRERRKAVTRCRRGGRGAGDRADPGRARGPPAHLGRPAPGARLTVSRPQPGRPQRLATEPPDAPARLNCTHDTGGMEMNESYVTLQGWVGGDVDVRDVGDTQCASLRVGSTPRYLRNGSWVDGQTSWFTVNCWRALEERQGRSSAVTPSSCTGGSGLTGSATTSPARSPGSWTRPSSVMTSPRAPAPSRVSLTRRSPGPREDGRGARDAARLRGPRSPARRAGDPVTPAA